MYKNANNKSRLGFSLVELSVVIVIIGIIIVGISKSSIIINSAKLSSARNLTKNSPVNDKSSDLAFWLETTLERSFDSAETLDQNPISSWKDINPMARNYFNFSQTGSERPLYIKNAINGLPAIRFDGINDRMIKANVTGDKLTIDGNQNTIFIVQKYYAPAKASSAIFWGSGGTFRINVHAPHNAGAFFFDYGACCGANGRMSFTVPDSYYDKPNIITTLRRSNGFGSIRINGSESLTSLTMTNTINLSNTATFFVGSASVSVDSQKSDIAEIIIFKTGLTNDQIDKIEKYLSDKWNIPLE